MLTRSRRRLSAHRALVCDILHYDRQIPSFTHSRTFELAAVEQIRQSLPQRVSWPVLFIKAYSLLSAECAPLRQAFMPWPLGHVYEHSQAIATLALSRIHEGEPRLFWPRLRQPDRRSLIDLQQDLERHQHEQVERHFGRQLRLSRLPTPLRRLAWWSTLNLSGHKRATRLGTFALTTLAGQGATIDRPPSIHTTTLSYGPPEEAGHTRVCITYDHRLMDGLFIARCLVRLEEILRGPIARELEHITAVSRYAADRAAKGLGKPHLAAYSAIA